MEVALLVMALFGHVALGVQALNRLHAIGLPQRPIKWVTAVAFLLMGLPWLACGVWLVARRGDLAGGLAEVSWSRPGPLALAAYAVGCSAAIPLVVGDWLWRHILRRPPGVLRFHNSRSADLDVVALSAEEHPHHALVRLPGNQMLQLDLTERVLDMPRLPPALDGLAIAHLSDFHFTGRIARPYFQEVVRVCNEQEPDLVALTGDLLDDSALIDWIPETIGRLRARYGVYFVLGNHDLRADLPRLLETLRQSGLVHVGGRWIEADVRGQRVVVAGNALPWLGPAPDLAGGPPRDGGPLRILLSHSPDQLSWARQNEADLLLAGHTHGGQIRLPLVGPIFSPSWHGLKYVSGVFYAPPTIMHVSQGISGEVPVRWNCPPEITLLRLHAATTATGGTPGKTS